MTQVILVHGMWSTGATLSPVAEYFRSKGCSVFAPTLPDHIPGGQPSEMLGNYSVRDYVNYLSDMVEIDQNTILVGHSMGGLLAQFLAAKSNPKALILLASGRTTWD